MVDRGFIDQLADVWASTADLCRDLTDEQWATSTDCPGWTVKDQLSHLAGTESMLLGRTSPPAAPARPYVLNPIGELNEAWVEERRARPGREVLAEFEDVTGRRLLALRAMTDEQLEAESPSPIGTVPYATFMDVRIMDCWVHEQDIRRALRRPGHLDGPAAETALRRFASSFGYVVGKRVAPPDGTTVVLEVSGAAGLALAVEMVGGRAASVQPPADPSVRIMTDAETFACLSSGRWAPERALASGRVAFAGAEDLGRRVVGSLATIP